MIPENLSNIVQKQGEVLQKGILESVKRNIGVDNHRSGYSVRGFDTDKEKEELIRKIREIEPSAKVLFKTLEELSDLYGYYRNNNPADKGQTC